MEYPKINSLWKREGWYFDQDKKNSVDYQKGRQSFIIGDYAQEEFGNIKKWVVEEKIDGTNIRIFFKQVNGQRAIPSILGRTAAASIPTFLLNYLMNIATWDFFDKAFNPSAESFDIYLFGEGYGPKIQKSGSFYSDEMGFCLFDINRDGRWFRKNSVQDFATKLGLLTPPVIGVMEEQEIVEYVKSKPNSTFAKKQMTSEGIIARAKDSLLFSNGNPVMWKLKCHEF